MEYEKFLETSIIACKEAGKILIKYYSENNIIEFKDDHSPVTIADTSAENKIISILLQNHPEHSILGEETGNTDNNSEYLWVIDPLDGTSNFSKKIPFFCTSISLLRNKVPIIGTIYDPIHDELFTGLKGKGSFLNNKKLEFNKFQTVPTKYVSIIYSRMIKNKEEVNEIFSKLNPPEYRIRNMGAAALELAYVAAGKLQGIVINGNNPWDVCAGILLIQESGGIITDFENNPWNFRSENIIAGHHIIHEKIISYFRAA
jgi:myo-inositol-1(or 4)-monophosphatase